MSVQVWEGDGINHTLSKLNIRKYCTGIVQSIKSAIWETQTREEERIITSVIPKWLWKDPSIPAAAWLEDDIINDIGIEEWIAAIGRVQLSPGLPTSSFDHLSHAKMLLFKIRCEL